MGENLGAMLVLRLADDHEKLNAFTEQLVHVRYAPTLGGLRTTLAHPANTSHLHMSEAKREKLGLYYGSIRLSVGLEEPEDIIADFKNALKVYD
ncbi:Cystathionine beta-lyase [bioreactor metagenome]|uniref:Cystathionine beta-lyase n=1 Tax=bioreactor metagenome TaxID=1076179 RepID=A0A645HP28_9ZZZZ